MTETPSYADPLQAAYAALFPLLGEAVASQIQRPMENARKLRQSIDDALYTRIGDLERRIAQTEGATANPDDIGRLLLQRGEVVRLRTFHALVPHLGEDALRYVLGAVEINGRLGDHVQPESLTLATPDRGPSVPEAERIEHTVAWALTTVRVLVGEGCGTGVVYVPRPAVAQAVVAINVRNRVAIDVIKNVKNPIDPWAVSDLLIISPTPQPE